MAAAVTLLQSDSLLTKILLGAIGGSAGYFVGQTLVSQATSVPASGNDIIQDWKNFMDSTLGVGVDFLGDLVTGGLLWYLGAAGGGALADVVVAGLFGGQVFPVVAAFGSGLGLSAVNNLLINPPYDQTKMNNVQACANAKACGCIDNSSSSQTAKNIASNQWAYFTNPFTMAYWTYQQVNSVQSDSCSAE
jgi:hypothetical protein